MSNHSLPDRNLQNLWQRQPSEGIRMSADQIRRRAAKFERRISRRNMREYIAAFTVVAFFAFQFWRQTAVLARISFVLLIAGTLYVVWQLYKRGTPRTPPAELGLTSGVEFFRRELERQRDLLKSVWRWYLGPWVPGLIVSMVATEWGNPEHVPHFVWTAATANLVVALFFVFVWRLNESGARRLQRQIDELDAMQRQG